MRAPRPPTLAERVHRASSRASSVQEQQHLAGDANVRVRCTIAERADLSTRVARQLAADPSRTVRRVLAQNTACPEVVLLVLVQDPVEIVRWHAVHHPCSTPAVWQAALDSGRLDAARAVAALGDRLDEESVRALFAHPQHRALEQLAFTSTSPTLLQRLAAHTDPRIRAAVAASSSTAAHLLEELADDPRSRVRAVVAGGSRVSCATIRRRAQDRSALVRWHALVGHPHDRWISSLLAHDSDEVNADQARAQLRYMPEDPGAAR